MEINVLLRCLQSMLITLEHLTSNEHLKSMIILRICFKILFGKYMITINYTFFTYI